MMFLKTSQWKDVATDSAQSLEVVQGYPRQTPNPAKIFRNIYSLFTRGMALKIQILITINWLSLHVLHTQESYPLAYILTSRYVPETPLKKKKRDVVHYVCGMKWVVVYKYANERSLNEN